VANLTNLLFFGIVDLGVGNDEGMVLLEKRDVRGKGALEQVLDLSITPRFVNKPMP